MTVSKMMEGRCASPPASRIVSPPQPEKSIKARESECTFSFGTQSKCHRSFTLLLVFLALEKALPQPTVIVTSPLLLLKIVMPLLEIFTSTLLLLKTIRPSLLLLKVLTSPLQQESRLVGMFHLQPLSLLPPLPRLAPSRLLSGLVPRRLTLPSSIRPRAHRSPR